MMYIELYTIKSSDYPVEPEELFSKTEYEEFLDFMEDEPSEFAPDMLSIFCQDNNIDEDSRCLGILAQRFSKNDQKNYCISLKDLNIEKGSLPIAEEISETELSLPMYYGMTDDEINYVIKTINQFGK